MESNLLNKDNLILILFFILLITYFFNYKKCNETLKNTLYFDNYANYQYIMDLNKKPCNTDNCLEENKDVILLVGNDNDNNHIFKLNNTYYKLNNDNLVAINEKENDYSYLDTPKHIPIDLKAMKLKVKLSIDDYNYVGIVSNNFYHQEYLLYEKPYDHDNELENKLYYYKLIKIIDGIYKTIYDLPPRNKISSNEYIWVAYGPYQLGPLVFN